MPERIQREEPIAPLSLSSAWRTTMALMEVFRDRPAPAFAFLLALAGWAAAVCRAIWAELGDPAAAGACLSPAALFAPQAAQWRRYALHVFWPLDPSYSRGLLTSAALLLLGYTLEHEVGTAHFAALFLGLHAVGAALLLHYRLLLCFTSSEAALAALAVVAHRVNPKVHTDGLDSSLRVPFAVEPRWHLWLLQSGLLLLAGDFPTALAVHCAGFVAGGALALRDPEVWLAAWRAGRHRSWGLVASMHVALLLFGLVFMPLTAQAFPADLLQALLDGRAWHRRWWQAAMPGSPPLLHLALARQLSAEALFICKLAISFALPLLLSPLRLWSRFYAGACMLLAMYAMNSPAWRYPHVGFLALLYLMVAFWKLPEWAGAKEHRT